MTTLASSPVLAWHFLPENRRLRYGDDREVREGETLTIEGPVELCARGLHASETILDALTYAPGCVVCRVEIGGIVVRSNDKLVGTTRKCLKIADCRVAIVKFAAWCAAQAEKHATAAHAAYAARAATRAAYAARAASTAAYAAVAAAASAHAATERKAQAEKLEELVLAEFAKQEASE